MCIIMQQAWEHCKQAVARGKVLEADQFYTHPEVLAHGKLVAQRCQEAFKEAEQGRPIDDISDEHLSRLARFTDGFPLADYAKMFALVPELVNVVTVELAWARTTPAHATTRSSQLVVCFAQLAEAIPVPGSGLTLPLDLHYIASRTSNSYFAPRRSNCVSNSASYMQLTHVFALHPGLPQCSSPSRRRGAGSSSSVRATSSNHLTPTC